jgi:hypothetical protein
MMNQIGTVWKGTRIPLTSIHTHIHITKPLQTLIDYSSIYDDGMMVSWVMVLHVYRSEHAFDCTFLLTKTQACLHLNFHASPTYIHHTPLIQHSYVFIISMLKNIPNIDIEHGDTPTMHTVHSKITVFAVYDDNVMYRRCHTDTHTPNINARVRPDIDQVCVGGYRTGMCD